MKPLLHATAILGATLAIGVVTVFGAPEKDRAAQTSGKRAASAPAPSAGVVLHFKGVIDGSECIEITSTHAYWRHLNWKWPGEAVSLNGVEWTPKTRPALPNGGKTRFLPSEVEFPSARLEKIRGRDSVVLQRRPDCVRVYINDTPNGASLYEFKMAFRPKPHPAKLQIVADIDGSDQLRLDATGARWNHRHWDWPKLVLLNGVKWRPREAPELKNQGKTAFLDGPVDFASAKLTVNAARDMAVLERTEDGLTIHFADNPLGRATYDLTISFGE